MTQNTPHLSNWFVSDSLRAKAELKYDTSQETVTQHCFSSHLKNLFHKETKQWLAILIELWNNTKIQEIEWAQLFKDWSLEEQKCALEFFSKTESVHMINAIFFYKLYPDKLFNELIHPEKLVSVRMRLGILHQFIELIQQQFGHLAKQNGLNSGVDYLFHGDELPQGILIEVNEEYRELIQSAVKNLKVKLTTENEALVTLDRLHDLGRAYKFWFNPNRLIDAIMVLQQRLVKIKQSPEADLITFHNEMVILYKQLTTTQCLDLYGYFANKDTRYLLYTLLTLVRGESVSWLQSITECERQAIALVFEALHCAMEALRTELQNRQVTTELYIYNVTRKKIEARRRNREAVFRIMAVYCSEHIIPSPNVEKLFNFIEE